MNAHARWLWPSLLVLFAAVLATPLAAQEEPSAGPAASSKAVQAAKPDAAQIKEKLLEGLTWRQIGPYRGGRASTCTGVPGKPDLYYFGASGGGVWKTADAGRSWKNISDGSFGGSIGAVAVSESDPNVIYVGGGEKTVRGNVSHGDGVWKSVDAGKTWKHIGLPESRHIPRIRIHPKDPDVVYAAVLGHLFGPNHERGVYRSRDGGKSWQRVLHANDHAGAVDLCMDPTNPRILYASTWRVKRTPYSLESGGEGSALWKSTDSGDTWKEISKNKGFPEGLLGIIGVTVSAANPERVYAIVENAKGGVFRSEDGGKTWKKLNDERKLRQRAWYYTRIFADPQDADVVYVVNVKFWKSKDGGKTFSAIRTPHGDNHDLWIDPANSLRMIEVNDGGANVSSDGGKTWSRQDNQPTAQFYRVATDTHFPYRIYGGQQDNSTVRIASRTTGRGIGERDWEPTAGGESAHIAAHPLQPEVVFGGSYGGYLTRIDHRTGDRRTVTVWPDNPMGWGAAELEHRFQWNFPIFFSPHAPHALYTASQYLLRSTNEGQSWEKISSDLTRNDKSKMQSSGGPITKDNTAVEYYGTIFAACESPHEKGVLWCGSDDGLLHISRDDGRTWQNVTPKMLPEWAMINSVEVHPFEKGGLYIAATRYKLDDFAPYLYKTLDYGKTWTQITNGITKDHFTRALRADPLSRGLLYAGTERGVYVSMDDGAHWQSLQLKLPVVPITDLAVKDGDLVASTQGRGFWILDDLEFLTQIAQPVGAVALFQPGPTYRMGGRPGRGPRGNNPSAGVPLRFWLARKPAKDDAPIRLVIADASGATIRTFTTGKPKGERGEKGKQADKDKKAALPLGQGKMEVKEGINVFYWDRRYAGARTVPGMILWGVPKAGPQCVPGSYQATLHAFDRAMTVNFEVKADPRRTSTAEDYAAQFAYLIQVRDKLTETHDAILGVRALRSQIGQVLARAKGHSAFAEIDEVAKRLQKELKAVEEALYQTKNKSPQDPLNFPIRLNNKLGALAGVVGSGDHPPTTQAEAVRLRLTKLIDLELTKYRTLTGPRLDELDALIRSHGIPSLALPKKDTPKDK